MYAAVPKMRPASVAFTPSVGETDASTPAATTELPVESRALASPKSNTFTVPSSRTLMFAGFRSRWMIPCLCAASSASAICVAIESASPTGIAALAIRSASVGPSTSSMTKARDAGVFEAMDLRDVRMIEGGEHLRFTTEAREAIGIVGNGRQQDLDRDLAIQLRVEGFVDLAHPARADPCLDLIRADPLALEILCGEGVLDLSRAGVSRKLLARSSHARSDSTSWRRASSPPQASTRYAGRRSAGCARASANTAFRRCRSSGGNATCCEFYSPARLFRGGRDFKRRELRALGTLRLVASRRHRRADPRRLSPRTKPGKIHVEALDRMQELVG